MATRSMGGEEKKWVPGDGVRGIITAPNNDNSSNITSPVTVRISLVHCIKADPFDLLVTMETHGYRAVAVYWHQLTQCWEWHPSLGADITWLVLSLFCFPLRDRWPEGVQVKVRFIITNLTTPPGCSNVVTYALLLIINCMIKYTYWSILHTLVVLQLP